MFTYISIGIAVVLIVGAFILFRVVKKNMLNDWRNKLVPHEPITVKCHYFVNGKPRYIYLPATAEDQVDSEHYKVKYDEDHLNEAIEDHIDDGLQIPEDVHHNYICRPMSEDELELLNAKWVID